MEKVERGVRLSREQQLWNAFIDTLPGGMTFGPDKALYISNAGDMGPGKGQIVRIAIAQ
jgi:hypothetical protein